MRYRDALLAFAFSAFRLVDLSGLPVNAAVVQPVEAQVLSEVSALAKSGQYDRALTLLDEKHLPHSARVSVVRSVLLDKTKPLIYPLAEARAAVRLNPKSALALTNLAVLLQRNGERADAIEKYRAATLLEPANWKAHLGLAQCLAVDGVDGRAIADRELKAAFGSPDDSAEKWSALGSTFLVLSEYARAQDCYSRALRARPGDYFLRAGLAKACLLNGEGGEAQKLFEEVVTGSLNDPELALLYARSKFVGEADFAKIADLGEHNFIGDNVFFYHLGRAADSRGWLELGKRAYAYSAANTVAPAAAALALIGNRSAAGKDDEARAVFEKYTAPQVSGAASSAAPPRTSKDPFALPLAAVGPLLTDSGDSSLKIVHAVFRNIKCGCRRPVLELKLRSQPGVLFACLQDEKNPPACFIYDAKVANAAAIIDKTRREEDQVDVISEEPVKSVTELVQLIQKATDQPDKHLFSIWTFQPAAMELPK